MRKRNDERDYILILVLLLFLGANAMVGGSWLVARYMTPMAQAYSNVTDYHVSENLPIGEVISAPEDLGAGIFLIKVQVGKSERPIQYPAVTAFPDQTPVGSKVKLKNITASGRNTLNDMFHVAVLIEESQ